MADLYIIGEKLKLREYIDKIREEYKYATMSWLEGVDAIYVLEYILSIKCTAS